jgi:phosphate/sulfate permease
VNTKTVSTILLAWLVTLPAAALLAALAYFAIGLI